MSRGNLNLVGGQPHQGSEHKRLDRQRNSATLATGHCYCSYLAFHKVAKVCATCARYDLHAREVGLRRLFGYVGFSQ